MCPSVCADVRACAVVCALSAPRALSSAKRAARIICHPLSSTDGRGLHTNTQTVRVYSVCAGRQGLANDNNSNNNNNNYHTNNRNIVPLISFLDYIISSNTFNSVHLTSHIQQCPCKFKVLMKGIHPLRRTTR